MFSIVAFSANANENSVLTNLSAVADPIATTNGNYVYVPNITPNLFGVYAAVGASGTAAQVLSPSIRNFAPYDVHPFDLAIDPVDHRAVRLFEASPIKLVPAEGLEAKTNNTSGSSEQHAVIAFLCDAPLAPVTGQVFTVKCTASITGAKNAWTNGALTFTSSLPAGQYNVVGMSIVGDDIIAGRLVFVGGGSRPGAIATDTDGVIESSKFRFGQLGVWGTFDFRTPPSLDIIISDASTSQTVYLDLIKAS